MVGLELGLRVRAFLSHGFHVVLIDFHNPQYWLSPTDQHVSIKGHAYHTTQIIQALDGLGLLSKP